MKAKLQVELILEDDNSVTVHVYDPMHDNNKLVKEHDSLSIMDSFDMRSPIISLLGSILSALSWMGDVKKIVDMRTGKIRDVSDRDYRKNFSLAEWDADEIQEDYDSKVEKGIIDPEEYPFEEFKKEFTKLNKRKLD